ncbi:uncharacterized protein BJ212DRAFT_1477370 [Suillus subaureus]|uniref:Uncharacterized protein n=1 Tax=Suillus subaureus TaxID=48587 RepID=A0A9P7EIQ8_9AGAM|nr:uncharacterized protein BJ212DRAFT_1477370 [Suillus subaureus]KAG1822967.1 hypothetical protein BJ212DRAFT_1477370 [Suillus subaureus]
MRGIKGTRGGTRGGSIDSANTTNASAPSTPVNIPPPPTTSTAAPSTSTIIAPVPSSKFNIKWESRGIDRTSFLVAYLMAHHGDCCVLFSKNKKKKNQTMQDDDSGLQPSSKEKGGIHAVIAKEIFAKDVHYSNYYQAYPQNFAVAVGNHFTLQTRGRVDPTDPSAAANLCEDVLRQLPTYDDLNELWHSIPSYAPKAFSSNHKADYSGHLLSMMHMKSALTSTAAVSSCPAPDDNNEFYDLDGCHIPYARHRSHHIPMLSRPISGPHIQLIPGSPILSTLCTFHPARHLDFTSSWILDYVHHLTYLSPVSTLPSGSPDLQTSGY